MITVRNISILFRFTVGLILISFQTSNSLLSFFYTIVMLICSEVINQSSGLLVFLALAGFFVAAWGFVSVTNPLTLIFIFLMFSMSVLRKFRRLRSFFRCFPCHF